MISLPFPNKFQQIWHFFPFPVIVSSYVELLQAGWAVNFTSFLNNNFGQFFCSFDHCGPPPLENGRVRPKTEDDPPEAAPLQALPPPPPPVTWSLSMLQLERGAVTLCSVCALLRNFDKDLHGDPMLLWLLLEVVTACGVTCCIFDGNAKSQRKKAEA